MKIDPGLKHPGLPPLSENRSAPAGSGTRATAPQTDVTLSSRAAQLKQLETQLAAVPLVDRARVDSIKEAIAAGRYTVKTENIAQGLLDSVKEMLHVAK